MKEITISVPTGTFPADVGDKVRVSLQKLNRFEMIDAFVMDVVTGCGVSDRVTLRYDETLLPYGASQITACMITGFQKQCACCLARMCFEVFGPDEAVEVDTGRHVLIFPGDFRLDQVKFYSPNPTSTPISLQVVIGGYNLFPHPVEMGEQALTVNRAAFSADFDDGHVAAGSRVEVQVVDGPQGMYYETPWYGLTICLNGIWYPHTKTVRGSLRRRAGIRPNPNSVLVETGDGTLVTDGDGNFVSES